MNLLDKNPPFRKFFTKDNAFPLLITIIVILSSHFIFPNDQLRIFLSFMILIPVFLSFKFEIGPIEYSIILLIFTSVELALNRHSVANQFALYSYWLLVTGVCTYFIKYLRYNHRNNK